MAPDNTAAFGLEDISIFVTHGSILNPVRSPPIWQFHATGRSATSQYPSTTTPMSVDGLDPSIFGASTLDS